MGRIGAMLLLALAAASCSSGKFKPLSPEPMVWVDEDSHDFGTIPGTATVDHIFTVKNNGGEPLNITRVQTSCGCTAAVLDHQFLQAGETTRLKVTFDPRGRRGKQARKVYIHSNDPKMPKKVLNIMSTIAPKPQPSPLKSSTTPSPKPKVAPAAPAPNKQ